MDGVPVATADGFTTGSAGSEFIMPPINTIQDTKTFMARGGEGFRVSRIVKKNCADQTLSGIPFIDQTLISIHPFCHFSHPSDVYETPKNPNPENFKT